MLLHPKVSVAPVVTVVASVAAMVAVVMVVAVWAASVAVASAAVVWAASAAVVMVVVMVVDTRLAGYFVKRGMGSHPPFVLIFYIRQT